MKFAILRLLTSICPYLTQHSKDLSIRSYYLDLLSTNHPCGRFCRNFQKEFETFIFHICFAAF